MAHVYLRGRIFWLRWYEHRQIHRKSLKTRNRRVALYHKAKKEQQLAAGKSTNYQAITFQQAAQAYLEATGDLKSPGWRYTSQKRLDLVGRALNGQKLPDLTPQQVEAALNDLARERKLSAKSRNDYLSLVRSVSRWCVDRGMIFDDFTHRLKLAPAEDSERTYLTREQREKVLEAAAADPDYPAIMTAFFTGYRQREIASLEWPDVDFEGRRISLRSANAKSKRNRSVPMHPRLEAVLLPLRKKSGLCFPPNDRNHWQRVRTHLQRWLKAAGARGERLGLHTCRHTFITLLLQAGESIWQISEWAGHADVRITKQRYAHQSNAYNPGIEKL